LTVGPVSPVGDIFSKLISGAATRASVAVARYLGDTRLGNFDRGNARGILGDEQIVREARTRLAGREAAFIFKNRALAIAEGKDGYAEHLLWQAHLPIGNLEIFHIT